MKADHLICPDLPSFNSTVKSDDLSYFSYVLPQIIDASDLFAKKASKQPCIMKLSLERDYPNLFSKLEVHYKASEDSNCIKTFNDETKFGCEIMKRECMNDVDPKEYFCCRFVFTFIIILIILIIFRFKQPSNSTVEVLSTHQLYSKYLSDYIMVTYDYPNRH